MWKVFIFSDICDDIHDITSYGDCTTPEQENIYQTAYTLK